MVVVFFSIRYFDRAQAIGEATECFQEIHDRTEDIERGVDNLAKQFHAQSAALGEQQQTDLFLKLVYPLTTHADFLGAEWFEPHPTSEGVFRVAHSALRPNRATALAIEKHTPRKTRLAG